MKDILQEWVIVLQKLILISVYFIYNPPFLLKENVIPKNDFFLSSPSYSPKFQLLECRLAREISLQRSLKFDTAAAILKQTDKKGNRGQK